MNLFKRSIVTITICSASLGCATLSNRQKSILTTVGAAALGGGIGYMTAPEGTLPVAHAGLWAGASAAVAGVASLFIFDSEKDKQALQDSNRKLDIEIKELKASIEPQLIEEIPEAKLSNLPSEIAKVVRPGVYRRFLIAPKFGGIWVKEKAGNTWYKRSQMLLYTKGEMMGETSEPLSAALNPDGSEPEQTKPGSETKTESNPQTALPTSEKQVLMKALPQENTENSVKDKQIGINSNSKGGGSNSANQK